MFYRAIERVFQGALNTYSSGLRWVLRHQPLLLTLTGATICLSVYLYIVIPKGFFPQQDTGRSQGTILGSQDISFPAMQAKLKQYPDIVMDEPEVATLYDAFGQRQVSTMYTQLNQYHVVMEVDAAFRDSTDAIRNLYVRSANGKEVPLSAFTHYETKTTALAVNHQGQFPAVTLSFNLAEGVALGDAVQEIEAAVLQMGVPSTIRASFQGNARAFQSSLASQPWLILAALVTVYIILGMLYESYIHPVTILSTLPSAGVGALLALLAFHTELSVMALIGIILLIGIVEKNAIMMIYFAMKAE